MHQARLMGTHAVSLESYARASLQAQNRKRSRLAREDDVALRSKNLVLTLFASLISSHSHISISGDGGNSTRAEPTAAAAAAPAQTDEICVRIPLLAGNSATQLAPLNQTGTIARQGRRWPLLLVS